MIRAGKKLTWQQGKKEGKRKEGEGQGLFIPGEFLSKKEKRQEGGGGCLSTRGLAPSPLGRDNGPFWKY